MNTLQLKSRRLICQSGLQGEGKEKKEGILILYYITLYQTNKQKQWLMHYSQNGCVDMDYQRRLSQILENNSAMRWWTK